MLKFLFDIESFWLIFNKQSECFKTALWKLLLKIFLQHSWAHNLTGQFHCFGVNTILKRLCQFFIERIKSVFLTSLNAKTRRQQIFLRSSNQRDLNICYHHRQCINSYLNKKNFKIYLNSMISDEELSNLLVLAF